MRAISGTVVFTLALAALLAATASARDCPPLWGVALEGHPITTGTLASARGETGLEPRMAVFFLQWPRPGEAGFFPLASLRAIANAGAVPVLTWEPMYLDHRGGEHTIPAGEVLSGAWDAYLDRFADQAAGYGGRFIIRLAHEMNLSRYHWGTAKKDYGPKSPGVYKKLYRYVVERFRASGARNVLWAFCPNAESLPHPRWHGAKWNRATHYYPGDDVVDIMGMDGYNWGTSRNQKEHGWKSRWLTFRQIFEPLRGELTALAPGKPLVVFETSSAARGGDRSQWVINAAQTALDWRMAAFCWFQADKEIDWRLLENRDRKALDAIAARFGAVKGCAGPAFR